MKTIEIEIRKLLSKIDKSKAIIAKERDSVREIYAEIESCLESFDEGIEGLDIGKQEIERAIDSLSQFV